MESTSVITSSAGPCLPSATIYLTFLFRSILDFICLASQVFINPFIYLFFGLPANIFYILFTIWSTQPVVTLFLFIIIISHFSLWSWMTTNFFHYIFRIDLLIIHIFVIIKRVLFAFGTYKLDAIPILMENLIDQYSSFIQSLKKYNREQEKAQSVVEKSPCSQKNLAFLFKNKKAQTNKEKSSVCSCPHRHADRIASPDQMKQPKSKQSYEENFKPLPKKNARSTKDDYISKEQPCYKNPKEADRSCHEENKESAGSSTMEPNMKQTPFLNTGVIRPSPGKAMSPQQPPEEECTESHPTRESSSNVGCDGSNFFSKPSVSTNDYQEQPSQHESHDKFFPSSNETGPIHKDKEFCQKEYPHPSGSQISDDTMVNSAENQ